MSYIPSPAPSASKTRAGLGANVIEKFEVAGALDALNLEVVVGEKVGSNLLAQFAICPGHGEGKGP